MRCAAGAHAGSVGGRPANSVNKAFGVVSLGSAAWLLCLGGKGN